MSQWTKEMEQRAGELTQDEIGSGIIWHLKSIERGISSLRLIGMLVLFVLVLILSKVW